MLRYLLLLWRQLHIIAKLIAKIGICIFYSHKFTAFKFDRCVFLPNRAFHNTVFAINDVCQVSYKP